MAWTGALRTTTSSTDPGHGRHFSTGLRRAASTKESVAEMAGEVSQVSPAPWIWPLLGVSRSDNMPPIAIQVSDTQKQSAYKQSGWLEPPEVSNRGAWARAADAIQPKQFRLGGGRVRKRS